MGKVRGKASAVCRFCMSSHAVLSPYHNERLQACETLEGRGLFHMLRGFTTFKVKSIGNGFSESEDEAR